MYQNSLIRVEIEESEIPWLKVFVVEDRKEFSECTQQERLMLMLALDIIEKEMLTYYRPTKINIASFGNYLPQVHWHIMARFEEDGFFPEPMWGLRQRESLMVLPPLETFLEQVNARLEVLLKR